MNNSRVKQLKIKDDFDNTKMNQNDRILIKYKNGKVFLLYVQRIEGSTIVCKYDPNSIQETFVNIESLINRDLGKYIDCVLWEDHSIEKEYTTPLDIVIRKLEESRTNLVNAYNSNYFCDNETILRDITAITKGLPVMMYEILFKEINKMIESRV